MARNNTNELLKLLATSVEQFPGEQTLITVVVGGQILTGTMITQDQFFALEDNIGLQKLFNEHIRDEKIRILKEWEAGNYEEDLPEELEESFIYLKNAAYILSSQLCKKEGGDGLSVQVRISDISTFSYRGINVS